MAFLFLSLRSALIKTPGLLRLNFPLETYLPLIQTLRLFGWLAQRDPLAHHSCISVVQPSSPHQQTFHTGSLGQSVVMPLCTQLRDSP